MHVFIPNVFQDMKSVVINEKTCRPRRIADRSEGGLHQSAKIGDIIVYRVMGELPYITRLDIENPDGGKPLTAKEESKFLSKEMSNWLKDDSIQSPMPCIGETMQSYASRMLLLDFLHNIHYPVSSVVINQMMDMGEKGVASVSPNEYKSNIRDTNSPIAVNNKALNAYKKSLVNPDNLAAAWSHEQELSWRNAKVLPSEVILAAVVDKKGNVVKHNQIHVFEKGSSKPKTYTLKSSRRRRFKAGVNFEVTPITLPVGARVIHEIVDGDVSTVCLYRASYK